MPIRRAISTPQEVAPVIRSNPHLKSLFVFYPSPRVLRDGYFVVDDIAVDNFWILLRRRFAGEVFPEYQVCEVFDIHRAVAVEWLHALEGRQGVLKRTKYGYKVAACDAKLGLVNLKPASQYDPWVNREWDDRITCYYAAFPWYVIDKYYLITSDEVKVHTGQQRIRPDGRPFTSVKQDYIDLDEDDFIQFRSTTGWCRGEWPTDRYNELCEAASRPNVESRQGGINRRISAETSKRSAREVARIAASKAATEKRIDRLGLRGHVWLEDFCRSASSSTSDEWFEKAIAEEVASAENEQRWQSLCKSEPRLRAFVQDVQRMGVRKSSQSQGNTVLLRRPPKPKVGTVRSGG